MKNPVERLADTLIHGDSQKAALVFSEKNRRYFTQFPATDGALLVTAEEEMCIRDSSAPGWGTGPRTGGS